MFLQRSLAFLIDLLAVSFCFSAAGAAIGVRLADWEKLALLLPALSCYFALFLWVWNGRTPGTRLLGLRVVALGSARISAKEAILRAVGVVLSYSLFGLGFMLSLVRTDGRNLPDLFSGTTVNKI